MIEEVLSYYSGQNHFTMFLPGSSAAETRFRLDSRRFAAGHLTGAHYDIIPPQQEYKEKQVVGPVEAISGVKRYVAFTSPFEYAINRIRLGISAIRVTSVMLNSKARPAKSLTINHIETMSMKQEFQDNQGHTIYHGDAVEVLKSRIANESIDLIFVDPPYNIGKKFSKFEDRWPSDEEYTQWAYTWIDECIRVLKPSGTMYFMASTQAMPFFDVYIRSRLSILSRIVWCYDSSGVQAKKYFGSLYEPILHCVKDTKSYCFNADDILIEAKTGAKRNLIDYRGDVPKPYNTQKIPGNVWEFPRVRYRMDEYEDHPSQKPEALLKRLILASSHVGDTVLDPFSGTFTTAAVAKALHRKSISIESQEEYVEIGLRRVLGHGEYKGKKLTPVTKNTTIRNGRSAKQGHLTMGNIFNANYSS